MDSELSELKRLRYFIRMHSQRVPHTFRERPDYFVLWDDSEFLKRFRLSEKSARVVLERIKLKLTHRVERLTNISPSLQLLLTLRFYASGSFQIAVADFGGIHQTTASRIIRKVYSAIKSLYKLYVKHPSTEEGVLCAQTKFYKVAKFPRCVGALDCTHVKIMSPGGDYAELFRNRKGYFSMNVQALCDADLCFVDVTARWPGSTNDSTIFNKRRLKYMFESGSRDDQLIWWLCRFQIRTRNLIERCFGVWKRRFPILQWDRESTFRPFKILLLQHQFYIIFICRKNSDKVPPFESIEQINAYDISMTRMPQNYTLRQEIH